MRSFRQRKVDELRAEGWIEIARGVWFQREEGMYYVFAREILAAGGFPQTPETIEECVRAARDWCQEHGLRLMHVEKT